MKAVFVDRDGTLNVNTGYVGRPALVALVPRAGEGLRLLNGAGYGIVVVSNQSGIARGYFSEADADEVDVRLRELLAQVGANVTAIYRCPHWPEDERPAGVAACGCRKPKPGMLLRAAADYDIDLRASWMIGDRLLDMQAGRAAGCRCVLVPGVPPHQPAEEMRGAPPDYRARDLVDAAQHIIAAAPVPASAASDPTQR
ncbi:MAG: HAD family hydrolase [Candidatus Eremiobacteraeota bacterium]|nr:HAD family hydrolase [Candidatus Eremiobacteraeota bacterium]